jgi:hypothetical protein
MQSFFFYFLETDQYGSDIFGSIDNVRILFYFILFFDLNSRAFQLEIKWCDPFENQRGQAMLTIGISKKTFASYSHGNKVHIQMFAHSIQIICKKTI